MLFYRDLEDCVFGRHELFDVDELIVLSGYVGFEPIERLKELPFSSTVIYGMYGEQGIANNLHNVLMKLDKNQNNTSILYSKVPIHSKCYLWKLRNKTVTALVGSANFSVNGLRTDYREILAEMTKDGFNELDRYIEYIKKESISCLSPDVVIGKGKEKGKGNNAPTESSIIVPNVENMSLLDRSGNVPQGSGLNWGFANAHVKPGDAYIKITAKNIENHPEMFPPKKMYSFDYLNGKGGKKNRQNDAVEFLWDDGTTMTVLFEGENKINGVSYPKQISSSPNKNVLGYYIRDRLGVARNEFITVDHLKEYGRTSIRLTKIAEGLYEADFSKP